LNANQPRQLGEACLHGSNIAAVAGRFEFGVDSAIANDHLGWADHGSDLRCGRIKSQQEGSHATWKPALHRLPLMLPGEDTYIYSGISYSAKTLFLLVSAMGFEPMTL
jgi:hypothetical protein